MRREIGYVCLDILFSEEMGYNEAIPSNGD
jgi:hypothetical protein